MQPQTITEHLYAALTVTDVFHHSIHYTVPVIIDHFT